MLIKQGSALSTDHQAAACSARAPVRHGSDPGFFSRLFNRRNGFLAMQISATSLLALSGLAGGNEGRFATGVANTAKNVSWLGAKQAATSSWFAEDAVERDISSTRANGAGALISAGTNLPQFIGNIGASGAMGDVFGAFAGITAYGLMAADQYLEQRRLRTYHAGLVNAGTEGRAQLDGYSRAARNPVVDPPDSKGGVQDFVFNKLPSVLLATRGMTFAASAAGMVAAGGGLPAFAMLGAGVLFTAGAVKEFYSQNPDFELKSLFSWLGSKDQPAVNAIVGNDMPDTGQQAAPEMRVPHQGDGACVIPIHVSLGKGTMRAGPA